jgi:hypothetical protein
MKCLSVIFVLGLWFSAFSQCTDNSDCKGNRECVKGVCTDRQSLQQPAPVQQAAPVNVAARMNFGRISVASNPQGGRIFLDGVNTGKTSPAILDSVIPGQHSIEVFNGYLSGVLSGVVGNATTDVVVQLLSGSGNLVIRAKPVDAIVTLDGVDKGRVSQELQKMPAGKHVLQINAKGFVGTSDTIDLCAGCTDTFASTLKALADLSIVTKPAQAAVTINGTEFGKTPFGQTGLMPGQYDVLLRKEKFVDTLFTVELSYDQKASLSVKLRHTDQFIKERRHKRLVVGWTVRSIAGAAAIGSGIGGMLFNNSAAQHYDEYRAISVVGDHSDAFAKVKTATTARNTFYGISIAMLGIFGISFVF